MKKIVDSIFAMAMIYICMWYYMFSVHCQAAYSQDIATDGLDLQTLPEVNVFWEALAAHNWPLAVGIGLTIVVWLCRRFLLQTMPKEYLPWFTLALAIIGAASARMSQAIGDSRPWWQGAIQGLIEGAIVGFTAMGAWDVKKVVKKKKIE